MNTTKTVLIGAVLLALAATLPFHYIIAVEERIDSLTGEAYGISEHKVFPKENLTFRNTFVTKKVVQEEIDKYNRAPPFQRPAIAREYFHYKLVEFGRIRSVKEDTKPIAETANSNALNKNTIAEVDLSEEDDSQSEYVPFYMPTETQTIVWRDAELFPPPVDSWVLIKASTLRHFDADIHLGYVIKPDSIRIVNCDNTVDESVDWIYLERVHICPNQWVEENPEEWESLGENISENMGVQWASLLGDKYDYKQ